MAFPFIQLQTWLKAVLPVRNDDRGASLVEYALLIALLAVVCLVAVNTIGGPTSQGLSSGYAGFP
jgi:pilus assembly protein Flp/PilA